MRSQNTRQTTSKASATVWPRLQTAVECENWWSVPVLTGCRGQCEGRHTAGSPPGCQRLDHRRNQGHTAHRVHPGCCAGSSAERKAYFLFNICVHQIGCQTQGPWTRGGPHYHFIWPTLAKLKVLLD